MRAVINSVINSLSDEMILERRNERKLKMENRDKMIMSNNLFEYMLVIVENLMNNEYSWHFMYPVDAIALGVPNYYEYIDNPMDLSTVVEKIKNKIYSDEEEFANDIRLICNNAMIFNPPDSTIYKFAEMMKLDFEKMNTIFRDIINNKDSESPLKIAIQNELEMKTKELELEKKDLSDLYDIKNELDMENSKIPKIKLSKLKYTSPSYEERSKLYELFQKLDPIYMRGLNDIIKEEMPGEMRKSGDEIQLNLDKMENVTIRKLEYYILACLGLQNEDIKEIQMNIPKEDIKSSVETQPIEKEKLTQPAPQQEMKGTIDSNINNSPQTIEPDYDESSESQSSSSESDDSSSSSEDEGNGQLFITTTKL